MDKNAFTHDATPTWSGFLYMTYIREHLDIIKKLKQTRDLMQNAVQNLLDSRLALLRNSKIVIQQGGLKENECPLCGHPFDSLTQLNQGIQSKTDALNALIGETAERIDDLKKICTRM